jgi:hypothetical protein
MGSTNGVKMNWPVVAIAFAVIGVPLGIAAIQDVGSDSDEEEILARIGEVDEIAEAPDPLDRDDDDTDDVELHVVSRWSVPAMEQGFFDEVFLGGPEDSKPALRGPLAAVEWGARDADPPDLSRWWRAELELELSGHPHKRLRAITLTFPDDGTAARVLASRWGESELVLGTDGLARRIWVDGAAGLRLVLTQGEGIAHATFGPFVPAAELVGDNGRFAFENHPILGATPRALAMDYGARFTPVGQLETGRIECPAAELSGTDLDCVVTFERGKASKITVTVDHRFAADAGPAVFAALKGALGTVREQASDDIENRWTFDRGYTVTQRVGEPVITVVRVAR